MKLTYADAWTKMKLLYLWYHFPESQARRMWQAVSTPPADLRCKHLQRTGHQVD